MGSKSSSSASTSTQDNRFDVGTEGIAVGANNTGTVNITSAAALRSVDNAVNKAFDFGTVTVDRSLDSVDNTVEVAANQVEHIFADFKDAVSDFYDVALFNQETTTKTVSALADDYGARLQQLKTNEQIGSVSQLTDIVKYVAIAAALIFIVPAIVKGK